MAVYVSVRWKRRKYNIQHSTSLHLEILSRGRGQKIEIKIPGGGRGKLIYTYIYNIIYYVCISAHVFMISTTSFLAGEGGGAKLWLERANVCGYNTNYNYI